MLVSICPDPADEEVAEAKKLINGMSKCDQKKGLANMSYWLRSTKQSDDAKGVRGAMRLEWFAQYIIMKTREKNAKTTSSNTIKHSSTSSKDTEFRWMGKFQLQQTVGEVKATAWINSKELKSQPDPVTGEDSEWMTEYRVVFVGGKLCETATRELAMRVENDETKPEDITNVVNTIKDLASDPAEVNETTATDTVKVKQEPGTDLIKEPSKDLSKVQNQLIELKTMRSQAVGMKYADALTKDMDTLIVQLKKAEKSLEAMVVNAKVQPDEKATMKLIVAMQKNDKDYEDMLNWSHRFGIEPLSRGNKRRRK